MEKDLINRIDRVGNLVTSGSDSLSCKRLDKAGYDKTLIGFVSEKVENENGSYYWIIQVEGAAYKIKPERCNITDTGQRVRLFLPNHSYKDKYAEVITDYANDHPDKVVYNDDDGTITETWKLNDMTQEEHVYTLSFENKGTADEQVTAITFPDGSVMTLEGFTIG